MTDATRAGLAVAAELAAFVEDEVLPDLDLDAEAFWRGTADILTRLGGANRALLARRDTLQRKLDDWHRAHRGEPSDTPEYRAFLGDIGYLEAEPGPFEIETRDVDAEIATIAAPQLVVPMLNARFLLNAANARWGSLYDALYGTDAIAGPAPHGGYDARRGAQVVAYAKAMLDDAVPLAAGSWADWAGGDPELADPAALVGRAGDNILLRHHGLHIEIVVDRADPIGRDDPAGIADIVLESAVTAIADLEDSVAAVDAADKVAGYRNWLGLVRGTLTARFDKNGTGHERRLAPDRVYVAPDGTRFALSGRALMFVRNVGHLMTTPAIRLATGEEAYEGLVDAIMTATIALHDRRRARADRLSRAGAIYIVKPKLHGPAEAAFTARLFGDVEAMLDLPADTIKLGLMDEERRTSANLAATIHALKRRIVFVNTGFLDRTGDEIHSAMHAGPMVRKGAMKRARWYGAYEDRNVAIALACGFSGRAQIGKGMWAQPDEMAAMLATKSAHPKSGATTAWVPSPTAATLHALHYHATDVFAGHAARAGAAMPSLAALLTIPLAPAADWSAAEIADELDTNVQSMLGYVVRWIDQGVGCSKVPDLADIGLMEDRATLRISSQHIANWLLHGVVSSDDVEAALTRMARRVDAQNAGAPGYRSLLAAPGIALRTCRDLVYHGLDSPNGYTEPLLHAGRAEAKRLG
ncbi:MAG: malate synthase G [Sphingomonadales bacterium]|nr:malate synthase G [Sphingomonadales bacterium]